MDRHKASPQGKTLHRHRADPGRAGDGSRLPHRSGPQPEVAGDRLAGVEGSGEVAAGLAMSWRIRG